VEKKRYQYLLFLLLIGLAASGVMAQEAKYPPLSEYLMPQADEVSLAKSAAPQDISDHATIRVFTTSGYQTVQEGDNGFVCMVLRGFTGAPTFTPVQVRAFITYDAKTRGPICLDPQAARTLLPFFDLRTKLGLEGKTADQIAEGVQAAYVKGEIPKRARSEFRLHVVGGPDSWTGGTLASTYNGLPSLLREPARQQTPPRPYSIHRGR
jgi:hypothetical protein